MTALRDLWRTAALVGAAVVVAAVTAWLVTGRGTDLPDGARAIRGGVVLEQVSAAQVGGAPGAGAVVDQVEGVVRITTYGSSSCPFEPVALALDTSDPAVLVVRMAERGGSCTADNAPTTTVVALPARYRDVADVEVRLDPPEPPR